ncbi:hypothetical protein BD626DRAFT_497320 [Schizophyllum amplum]|uniref:Uncharacterized protein n=1 Tax=Schizophyllum amplum TaxID=97359 RepID=A0A550CDY1_9AGAR|nr:hypothetical protein BD626DRAFT_497320 [Auriculariopsis ampla]
MAKNVDGRSGRWRTIRMLMLADCPCWQTACDEGGRSRQVKSIGGFCSCRWQRRGCGSSNACLKAGLSAEVCRRVANGEEHIFVNGEECTADKGGREDGQRARAGGATRRRRSTRDAYTNGCVPTVVSHTPRSGARLASGLYCGGNKAERLLLHRCPY